MWQVRGAAALRLVGAGGGGEEGVLHVAGEGCGSTTSGGSWGRVGRREEGRK